MSGQREKAFNAPLTVVILTLSMPVLYYFQRDLIDGGMSMALVPALVERGHWTGLLTVMLVHGSWTHVLMNAIACLSFGTPVARMLGDRIGPMIFLLFYVACGLASSLVYSAIHWGSMSPVVGASGAVFGLIGAATRMPLGGYGPVLPLRTPGVLKAAAAWMGVNLLIGLVGYMPGVGGGRIAWEAHAAGFVFGILAVGPLAAVFRDDRAHRG